MYVSYAYSTIFFHNPKTAGTSMHYALMTADPSSKKKQQIRKAHKQPCDCLCKLPAETEDFWKFCFVRNPWDRMVAVWKSPGVFIEAEPDISNGFLSMIFVKDMPFGDFVQYVVDHPDERSLRNLCHCQVCYTRDCDFVGRFENLAADWATVCKHMGVDMPLGHLDPSADDPEVPLPRIDYALLYTPKEVESVATLFAEDVAAFGYEFGS